MDTATKRQILLACIRRRLHRQYPSLDDTIYITLSLVVGFGLGAGIVIQTIRLAQPEKVSGYIRVVKTNLPLPTLSPAPFVPDNPMYRDPRGPKMGLYLVGSAGQ
jgi:hypothetical protein